MERSTQFRRTDRAIIDALIRLLKTRSFDSITVQNILDETPVTRATFYTHFRDKYEVAERMQEMYVQMLHRMPTQMGDTDRKAHPRLIQEAIAQYGDILQALIKIHTDQVDLRSITAEMYKKQYLSQSDSPYAEAEADIYAQAMTALQLSYLSGNPIALEDEDYYDKVMVSVFLRILRLEKDQSVRRLIFDRLPSQRDGSNSHSRVSTRSP